MIWESAKSAKQIVLDGVTVEVDKADSSLVSVTLTDSKGNKVRVRHNSYNMCVEIPAAPKLVDKFVVTGDVVGVPVSEVFDNKYEAENRRDDLVNETRNERATVSVEKIQIEEEIPF